MKRTLMSGAFLIIGAVLFSGCMTYHSKTQPQYLSENSSIKLNITQPVAIVNVSSKAPHVEEEIGHWIGWKVKGSLYDFTESTVGITKEIMQRNKITIDDKADKRLELSIDNAESVQGAVAFWSNVTLKVKTGSGLQREFNGKKSCANGYRTTAAFEMAMAQAVELMLQDKYIIEYLEK
jgi:hypothetical protein